MDFIHTDRTDFTNITAQDFSERAIELYHFQYKNNTVYRAFCDLTATGRIISTIEQIPFLPISFFKTKDIKSTDFIPEIVFESSGTTGTISSKHFVKDVSMYEKSFLQNFIKTYGDVENTCILGLLPSYLERSSSSLVYMVNALIERSNINSSGFYLYDHKSLHTTIKNNEATGQATILIGVTYALLDFAIEYSLPLKHTTIIETGGMKGRKKELTRSEVHEILTRQFETQAIHSEYGMTELLSQAYATENGIFESASWLKFLVRSEDDPFHIQTYASLTMPVTGAANIIDLANVYSCAFIATDDMIRMYPDGRFEILGRVDNSDIRGCSLLLS